MLLGEPYKVNNLLRTLRTINYIDINLTNQREIPPEKIKKKSSIHFYHSQEVVVGVTQLTSQSPTNCTHEIHQPVAA
jgi:hypothetical protein